MRGIAARPGHVGHYRAWRNAARELSSRFISASERRKARVDSAPWFRLTGPPGGRRSSRRCPGRTGPGRGRCGRGTTRRRRRASFIQAGSSVARYASRQAETVALASIGCWSNWAGSPPLAVEAVAADRPEVALGRLLDLDQPAQGLQADLQRPGVAAVAAAGDQGVRQPGVVVGQDLLEPGPVGRRPSARTARPAGPSARRGPGR